MEIKKTEHLTLKHCDEKICNISSKEARLIAHLILDNPDSDIAIGGFGCAIGSGIIVQIGADVFDVTDYDSW